MNPHKLLITNYTSKADRRETLDRLTHYYQEAGHNKTTARALAKKRLRFGKN